MEEKTSAKRPQRVGNKLCLERVSYKQVTCDKNGWVDATKFLPMEYDLVLVWVNNSYPKPGWWTGMNWDGKSFEHNGLDVKWRRKEDEEIIEEIEVSHGFK